MFPNVEQHELEVGKRVISEGESGVCPASATSAWRFRDNYYVVFVIPDANIHVRPPAVAVCIQIRAFMLSALHSMCTRVCFTPHGRDAFIASKLQYRTHSTSRWVCYENRQSPSLGTRLLCVTRRNVFFCGCWGHRKPTQHQARCLHSVFSLRVEMASSNHCIVLTSRVTGPVPQCSVCPGRECEFHCE